MMTRAADHTQSGTCEKRARNPQAPAVHVPIFTGAYRRVVCLLTNTRGTPWGTRTWMTPNECRAGGKAHVVGLFLLVVRHLSKAKQAPCAQLNSSPMSSTWVYLDDRGSWQHFDSGASCVALMHAIHRWPLLLLCMVGARVLAALRSNAVTTSRHHASCGVSYYGCAGTLHSSIYASF
jgi:hypothetical protein